MSRLFIPPRYCTNSSGGCFVAGECLGSCVQEKERHRVISLACSLTESARANGTVLVAALDMEAIYRLLPKGPQ